ncbi:MAG: serine/threonine protein kinase [Desulfovibrio sp.]
MWTSFDNVPVSESCVVPLNTGDTFLNYRVGKMIHEGISSRIFLGSGEDGRPYVFKQFHGILPSGFLSWQNEARFICPPECSPRPMNDLLLCPVREWDGGLIIPYYDAPDLRGVFNLRKNNPSLLAEEETHEENMRISAGIVGVLQELKARKVIHHDIKPENILYDRSCGVVKVIDFGLACIEGQDDFWQEINEPQGTPDYIAPEALGRTRGNYASDIFSLGVTLYELFTGILPFPKARGEFFSGLRKFASPTNPQKRNAEIPQEVSEVILGCLEKRCRDRASIDDVASVFKHYISTSHLVELPPPECEADEYRLNICTRLEKFESKKSVLVFVSPDERAKAVYERAYELANEGAHLMFAAFIPAHLEEAEYKALLMECFNSLTPELHKCRKNNYVWGVRILLGVDERSAAVDIVRNYSPKHILAGFPRKSGLKALLRPGVVHILKRKNIDVEVVG